MLPMTILQGLYIFSDPVISGTFDVGGAGVV